jgi:hypothetical protein
MQKMVFELGLEINDKNTLGLKATKIKYALKYI